MPCACLEKKPTVDRVAHVLDAVMNIDGGHLEQLSQPAHEGDSKEVGEPPAPVPGRRPTGGASSRMRPRGVPS